MLTKSTASKTMLQLNDQAIEILKKAKTITRTTKRAIEQIVDDYRNNPHGFPHWEKCQIGTRKSYAVDIYVIQFLTRQAKTLGIPRDVLVNLIITEHGPRLIAETENMLVKIQYTDEYGIIREITAMRKYGLHINEEKIEL